MKICRLIILLLIIAVPAKAQDSLIFRRISDEIMLRSNCYENLRTLCKTIKNRISGSVQAEKAVIWGQKAMAQTGADRVWLQPVDVPHWVRGYENLKLRYGNGKFKTVKMLSLGNSVGTDGQVWEAEIVMVHSFDELKQLPDEQIKGKIVFFNYRFRQDFVNTFQGYGDAVKYRSNGPSIAARRGARAVIIRSISTGVDDVPHTGALHYIDTIKAIPAVAVGNYTADTLENALSKMKAYAQLETHCKMMENVRSYNVIGEIKGTEHPERIIVIGGHLDSWDVGEGANDDGSGCVQSMEVLRTFTALGIKPKCTIRAVLFMNEENGLKGGIAYADSAKKANEHHILAIETDAGGFTPRGIGLEMSDERKEQIRYFRKLFFPYGVYDFEHEEGGSDISPLKKQGVPMAGLLPDSQRYFEIHHTNNDVFENVNHRELKLGAVALTQLVYLVSYYGLK
ncbi:MAG: M20/M25/M40 family metallo-hydrolase [Taibaiella sp.]|nr:M20/M25/M40 family metallo-hydrolase [Taibaiella sp.]